jgi:hypothetical protein
VFKKNQNLFLKAENRSYNKTFGYSLNANNEVIHSHSNKKKIITLSSGKDLYILENINKEKPIISKYELIRVPRKIRVNQNGVISYLNKNYINILEPSDEEWYVSKKIYSYSVKDMYFINDEVLMVFFVDGNISLYSIKGLSFEEKIMKFAWNKWKLFFMIILVSSFN